MLVRWAAMANLKYPNSKGPVPPVHPDDLKRVWVMFLETRQQVPTAASGTVGIDARLLAQQCSSGADLLAISFRRAMLEELFKQGLLNDWREGDALHDSVFSAIAAFPMQIGAEAFDPNAFLEQLRSSTA